MNFNRQIPLALYIHFPWCIKKCPYCDFNSHTLKEDLPEQAYITALLANLDQSLEYIDDRKLVSIFMGGGTPSLFSASAIDRLLTGIRERCSWQDDIEITLEANPSTVEQQRFKDYRQIGINRLSLGIQSFNDKHLKKLGRVHDSGEAIAAIETVQKSGFTNYNLDLMFGLPEQTLQEALDDLQKAIHYAATHLSWYELTLEPNTAFWQQPPPMPSDELTVEMQEQGQVLLQAAGFDQYEVSAYSRQQPCRHNVNYWEFGDYLAIGAGSHAKITQNKQQFLRYHHFRHPKQYLDQQQGFVKEKQMIPQQELPFEYFLNTLRLKQGAPLAYFHERTGLTLDDIKPQLRLLEEKGWIQPVTDRIVTTAQGYRFLNDVVGTFLAKE